MKVSEIGNGSIFVSMPDEVEALLHVLGPLHRCGQCVAFYVLATNEKYHHVYGVRTTTPGGDDPVHVHVEPDSRH